MSTVKLGVRQQDTLDLHKEEEEEGPFHRLDGKGCSKSHRGEKGLLDETVCGLFGRNGHRCSQSEDALKEVKYFQKSTQ